MTHILHDALDFAVLSHTTQVAKKKNQLGELDLASESKTLELPEGKIIELRQVFLKEKGAQEAYEIKKRADEINELVEQYQTLAQLPGEAIKKLERQNQVTNEIIARYLFIHKKNVISNDSLDFILYGLLRQKKTLLFARFLSYFNSSSPELFSLENNFFQQEVDSFISLIKSADFLLEEAFDRSRVQLIHIFMIMRALISYTNTSLCPPKLKKRLEKQDSDVLSALCDKLRPCGEESTSFMAKLAVLYVSYLDKSVQENPGYHQVYVCIHMLMFLPEIIDEKILTHMVFNSSSDSFIDLLSVSILNSYLHFLFNANQKTEARKNLDSLFELCNSRMLPFSLMPDFFLYLKKRAKSGVDSTFNAEAIAYYRDFMRRCDERLSSIQESISDAPEEEKNLILMKARYRLESIVKVVSKKELSEADKAWFNLFYRLPQMQLNEKDQANTSESRKNPPKNDLSYYFSVEELEDLTAETLPITPFKNLSYDKAVSDLRDKCDTFFSASSVQWNDKFFDALAEKVVQQFSQEEVAAFYKKAVNTCLKIVSRHQYGYWMTNFVNQNEKGEWDWARCKNGNYGREYVNIAKMHFQEGLSHIITTLMLLERAEEAEVDQRFLIHKTGEVQSALDLMNENLNRFHLDSQVKAQFFRGRAEARRKREAERAKAAGEVIVEEEKKTAMPETRLHTSEYGFFSETAEEITRLKKVTARL